MSSRFMLLSLSKIEATVGLGYDVVDHGSRIVGLIVNRNLSIRTRAVPQALLAVVDLRPAAQLVHHVVDEFEQLVDQGHALDLLALAEVDQLAADAVARGAPFVLGEQQPAVQAEAQVLLDELVQL